MTADQVLGAFEQDRNAPVKLPVLYRVAMFLVAIGMLLLPILYLGVVAIAGFAVYYHATENVHLIEYKERIAAAKSEKSGGILHLEAPASRLFSNFEKLSQEVTSWDYANRLGEAVKSAELVPFSEYQESIDQSQEALDSTSNFGAGILYCDTPPPITAISIPSGHEKQALEEAKASFLSQSEEFKNDFDRLLSAEEDEELKSYQPDISLTGRAASFRKATDVDVYENALRRLTRFTVEVCNLAQDLRDVFGERGYPFAAKGRTMLLRDAIVADVPTVRDLAESCATAKEVLTRYHNTFWRVTAGLMGIAIRVEEEMGIEQGHGAL